MARTKRATVPASIGNISIDDSLQHAQMYWVDDDLYPEATRAGALARLLEQHAELRRHGITTIGELAKQAGAVLAARYGDDHPDWELDDHVATGIANPLHLDRNLLLAMAMTSAVRIGKDPRPIADVFVQLGPRCHDDRRPSADDEIGLCRIYNAWNIGRNTRSAVSSLNYIASENGVSIIEIPEVFLADLGPDWQNPDILSAPGHIAGLDIAHAPRDLPLDGYARKHLPRGLELRPQPRSEADKANIRLGYNGHNIGEYASSSVKRQIDRMHETLGIHHLTASSIYLWRARTEFDRAGLAAAKHISGITQTDRITRKLGLYRNDTRPQLPKQVRFD